MNGFEFEQSESKKSWRIWEVYLLSQKELTDLLRSSNIESYKSDSLVSVALHHLYDSGKLLTKLPKTTFEDLVDNIISMEPGESDISNVINLQIMGFLETRDYFDTLTTIELIESFNREPFPSISYYHILGFEIARRFYFGYEKLSLINKITSHKHHFYHGLIQLELEHRLRSFGTVFHIKEIAFENGVLLTGIPLTVSFLRYGTKEELDEFLLISSQITILGFISNLVGIVDDERLNFIVDYYIERGCDPKSIILACDECYSNVYLATEKHIKVLSIFLSRIEDKSFINELRCLLLIKSLS